MLTKNLLQAKFEEPVSVAFHPAGKWLLVADLENNLIRKIDLQTLLVTTVAG
jgi:sugar lactone lactonase YvrE